MKTKAIFDISLINEGNIGEINNNLYILGSDPIAQNIFYDKSIEIMKDINFSSKSGIILLSKLNEIIYDFNRLYLILRQLDYFERNNLEPLYKSEHYPHMHYILDDSVEYIHPYWVRKDLTISTKIKIYARNLINRSIISTNKKNIIDGYMKNPLLLSYVDENNKYLLDHRLHEQPWRKLKNIPPEIGDTIKEIQQKYKNILYQYDFNKRNLVRANKILQSSIDYHIKKANNDYNLLPHILDKKYMQDTFISGTPKYLGRLVGSYYQKMSKSVWRFAHGGDRAFFNDYNFSIVEFPYCNKYFCHSSIEASNIKKRLAEKRIINLGFDDIEFTSTTNKRSINIYNKSIKPDQNKKNIVYFCGTYIGEKLTRPMSERCPDLQYIEWQSWLLSTLKQLNYNVIIKRHPKGILTETMFYEKYSDEVIYGDTGYSSVSCYLFDFFGTAMFDAMATKTGIIYFDMGLREFDENSKKDFYSRCAVVKCSLNNNRYRINKNELSESLEIGVNYNYKNLSKFYETYMN